MSDEQHSNIPLDQMTRVLAAMSAILVRSGAFGDQTGQIVDAAQRLRDNLDYRVQLGQIDALRFREMSERFHDDHRSTIMFLIDFDYYLSDLDKSRSDLDDMYHQG